MRGRGDRQEFGDALKNSKQGGLKERRQAYEALAFRCGFCLRVGCWAAVGDAGVAGACAAARVGAELGQKLTIAAAMKTLEYVPVMMPTTIVNANPCSTSPPKKKSASAVSRAVPEVITVRPRV